MSSHANAAHVEEAGAPPHIHHMDPLTAYGAAKLGMWLFLGTEILLFAVLFCGFAIMRWYYLEEFHKASGALNVWMGAINTVVLLLSSFTAACAVTAAQSNNNRGVIKHFGFSIFCGFVFLCIKAYEYSDKASHGLFPTQAAFWSAEHLEKYGNFFGIYYAMTGLHALHVVIGMVIMAWVVNKARRNRFSSAYFTPVELGALYWHLVDLIWIYLFPLLYLVG